MTADGLRVIIRADGNSAIGLGHLRRCGVLADWLRTHGADVSFVRRADADVALTSAVTERFHTHWLEPSEERGPASPGSADAEETLTYLQGATASHLWAVVDHYDLGEAWEAGLRAAGHRVLAIDDYRDRRHAADVLVSEAPVPFRRGMNAVENGVQLIGFDYALLPTAFVDSAAPPGAAPARHRVFVSFGGSDPTRVAIRFLDAIADQIASLRADLAIERIDVIIGPANRDRRAIEERCLALPGVIAHYAPHDFSDMMRSATIVLCSGGSTLVEAIAARKPCGVVVTADNQMAAVEALQRLGLIHVPEAAAETARRTEWTDCLALLVSNWTSFSERAFTLACIDGRGAERLGRTMARISAGADPWQAESEPAT